MRLDDHRAAFELFIVGLLVAAGIIVAPQLGEVLSLERTGYLRGAGNACPPPEEFEQLHIVVAWREGRLKPTGCLYVGARGRITQRSVRQVAAQ